MEKIPPFKLELQPLNEDAANLLSKLRCAPPEIDARHQLGGEPDFIQSKEYPTCPDCGKVMAFYAQLDSINEHISLADWGMVYVFVCFYCNNSTSFIQSY